MRLTLRTLLAYLDDTLEPQDAELLRSKLAESGFATQLVQRIRASLANPSLSAPAPDAVAPVEEANMICEYLDSTLSAEQVAEIERACLESEPHLAEAAACHQILTMVLGKPAEVSPALRQRVYELPDRELKDIPTGGNFSSLAIPTDSKTELGADLPTAGLTGESGITAGSINSDDIPTMDAPPTPAGKTVHPTEPVTPVGPADSGVSDAPTRLRESGAVDDGEAPPVIAGARPAESVNRSDMYGGTVRPSRITPWLVSLALAGVLLFALAQIFAPLLNPRVAKSTDDSIRTDEILVAPEDAPPMEEFASSPVESLPAPDESFSTENDEDDATGAAPSESSSTESDSESEDMAPPVPTGLNATAEDPDSESSTAPDEGVKDASTDNTTQDGDAPPMPADQDPASTDPGDRDPVMPANLANSSTDEEPKTTGEGPDSDTPKPEQGKKAKILSENAILVGRMKDGDWVRLKKDVVVGPGATLVCSPLFQGHMTSEAGVDVMLVGATEVAWETGEGDLSTTLAIQDGRVLVGSLEADVTIGLRFGDTVMGLNLKEPETVVAITRSYFRAPGFDSLKDENHISNVSVLAVQGEVLLNIDGVPTPLVTGDRWKRRGDRDPEVEQVETAPAWIENPDADQDTVYTLARETLLELVEGDQPITKSLREATTFRRSEVAALAGRALLAMGVSDVYFGSDGLLSKPDQRNYWPDHYQDLVSAIDRDGDSAMAVLESIGTMESADAQTLFQLLTGFSQKQLVEGRDATLVDLLDSNSMAVRVLARENLRSITGIKLSFKPEQDNAVRRASEIKKWAVRLRKGDIRWKPAD